MKYIRTKEGVYELVDTYYMYVDGVETYMYDNKGRGVEINGNQILKQSDTIEELCDEFVVRDSFDKYCLEIDSNYESLKCNGWLNGDYIIYGAIWTNKGLIYIAKMNEDGILYLI